MQLLIKLAWRELFFQKTYFFLLLFSFSVGSSSVLAIQFFRSTIQSAIETTQKNVMAADLLVSSRRAFSTEEKRILETQATTDHTVGVDLLGMASAGDQAKLAQIRALEGSYPLRGNLPPWTAPKRFNQLSKEIWVDEDLANALEIKAGDHFTLGLSSLTVSGVFKNPVNFGSRGFATAGQILLPLALLAQTGLLKSESTANYVYLLQVGDATVEKDLKKKLTDSTIQIVSPAVAAENSFRPLVYLGDFLGLAALIGLLLALIGAFFIELQWIQSKVRWTALQSVLGFSQEQRLLLPFLQISLIFFLSLPLCFLLSYLEIHGLLKAGSILANANLLPQFSIGSTLLTLFLIAALSLLFVLPIALSILSLSMRTLLQEDLQELPRIPWQWCMPALLGFAALTFWICRSVRLSEYFLGGIFGSIVTLVILAIGLRWLAVFTANRIRWFSLRHAILLLSRNYITFLFSFATFSLCLILFQSLPQIRNSFLTHLKIDSTLPTHFLFDIQPEQKEQLISFLNSEQIAHGDLVPLVRSRILTINDLPFERTNAKARTREQEMENRSRNRGFNLTYRQSLSAQEEIVKGPKQWPEHFSDTDVPISLESGFASRMNISLGDRIAFDVQGSTIKGKVWNFRRVLWTSLQPNFFISFPDGVLNDAPKTLLLSLSQTPARFAKTFSQKFPNVSVIDLRATVSQALDFLDQMRSALSFMAIVVFLGGVFVLLALSLQQANALVPSIQLFTLLGCNRSRVLGLFFWRSLLLGLASSITGGILALGISHLLMTQIFSNSLVVDWSSEFRLIILGVVLSLGCGMGAVLFTVSKN